MSNYYITPEGFIAASSNIVKLDTHYYDNFIKQYFPSIKQHLPPISEQEFNQYWHEILELARGVDHGHKEKGIPCLDYESTIKQLLLEPNDIEGNTQYSCKLLGAQVWKTIRENKDGIILFMEQFKDMILTSGKCLQGRLNRYLQVFIAFNDIV